MSVLPARCEIKYVLLWKIHTQNSMATIFWAPRAKEKLDKSYDVLRSDTQGFFGINVKTAQNGKSN